MLIPVIRLLVPLDALHSASRIDTTRLKLSAPLGVCVSETIWSRSSGWAVLRQRREHALGLLGDRRGVGDEPEEADPGDQRREDREESRVGDAAGEDPDVVRRRLLERPAGDLPPALGRDLGGHLGLVAGPLRRSPAAPRLSAFAVPLPSTATCPFGRPGCRGRRDAVAGGGTGRRGPARPSPGPCACAAPPGRPPPRRAPSRPAHRTRVGPGGSIGTAAEDADDGEDVGGRDTGSSGGADGPERAAPGVTG